MRRKDREITYIDDLKDIINKADVCRIAFAMNHMPYIVTMNFGCRWNDMPVLYFHCAKEGKKLDYMRQNSTVCFEMDVDHEIIRGDIACGWSMRFRSIVGYGLLEAVRDPAEKKEGLGLIMEKYGFTGSNVYDEKIFNATEILKLIVTELSGKEKA